MTPSDDRTRVAPPLDPTPATVTSAPSTDACEGTQVQHAAPTHLFPSSGLPAVPGYAVVREIARGGMGVVYAANDPLFDREVAIKVMHPGQDAGRFVVESKVTAQLPHPGVPPVYSLGTLTDGRPFLAMKLIEGQTLADMLQARQGAPDRAGPELLGAFEQICQTVGFAHSRGIVHRDLKPANVMVGAFGEVLVMDWGLAKEFRIADCGLRIEDTNMLEGAMPRSSNPQSAIRNPQSQETQAGQVKGTPAYMAPEQARGETVDTRADVFALGGILAVILTGRPPFLGDTALGTVKMAAQAQLSDCHALLDGCGADSELVALAKRCLAPQAGGRFADAGAVAEAVAAYRVGVEERLKTAERDRAVSAAEAREQRKRRKVQLALAASVLLIVAGGGGVAWWQDRQAAARQQAAERDEADRRETEARLAGERDAEARNKAEQARQGVRAGLSLATDLRRQYKFKSADAALAQAAELAKGGAPELLAEVARARGELALVVRLDDIRFRKWAWVAEEGGKGRFNTALAPAEYRAAFADHGLDLGVLPPAEAARRIAASGVRNDLVAAVDDWALYEPDAAVRNRLLEAARRGQPGPWLDRLRTPAVWGDKDSVAKLAADADTTHVASTALSVLAALMKRHDLDPAPLLVAARSLNPTDFELAFTLGQRHVDSPGGEQIGPYEAARAIRPENLAVWVNLGNALAAKGDVDGAVAAYRRAVALDPKSALARSNLGVALKEKGDLVGAVEAQREAVRLDPKYTPAYVNLASALREKGDVDGAVAALKQVIRLEPKSASAHTFLGNILKSKGEVDGAVAEYEEAIRCEPGYALAHHNLGGVLKEKGNVDGAIDEYKKAIGADPKYALAHYNLGGVLHDKGDVKGAIASLREAVRLDPKLAIAHYGLGIALQESGDLEGAVEEYREAIRLEPKHAPERFNLGVALKLKGDLGGAIAAYREAIRLDPKLAVAHYNLGVALRERGDVNEAVAAYEESVKHDPEYAPAHLNLAVIYMQQGKLPKAVACARTAIRLDPKSANAQAILGLSLQQAGDIPGARVAYAEAIRLDPKKWGPLLPKLPPVPVAPPPREVTRP